MWPLKHPKVYRASRSEWVFMAAVGFGSALALAAYFLSGSHDFMGFLPDSRQRDLALRALWCIFIATTLSMFFMRQSLTIGPDEVVLRFSLSGTTRIRQDDILGRRKRYTPRQRLAVDTIMSKQHPDVSITIPPGIRRDEMLERWLYGLPNLDDPHLTGPGRPFP